MSKAKKIPSPMLRAIVEARKQGLFARSKSWGGKDCPQQDRKRNKQNLRKENY
jgi:hypothetical protein